MKKEQVKEQVVVDGITININVSNDMELPLDWGAAFLGNSKAFDAAMKALKIFYVNKLILWKTDESKVVKEIISQFEIEKMKYDNAKEKPVDIS